MCGIAGIINFEKNKDVNLYELKQMTDIIINRGPDDEGFYLNKNVGFGFRRLSIIDLESGKQPISNEDDTIYLIMNGEIYNYIELREYLISKGHLFKTQSDTEVLVHLYEECGPDFVKKLRGMFSFAIHDINKNIIIIGRDRTGIKPLFYSTNNNSFVFGSELKQIKKVNKILEFNNEGILDYFTYGYSIGDKTCYKNINKVLPAHYLIIDLNNSKAKIYKYWELIYKPNYKLDEKDWIELLDKKLEETIKSHMISDVPLGAFLSGGVDSSAVVSKMASLSKTPIKTFSIGFKEEKYNELKYAKIISEKFQTDHHELIIEPSSINIIKDLVNLYDEPYADSSAIPTFFLSKMTRQNVTVALSGDGGDELFAGYNSYKKFDYFNRKLRFIPNYTRELISKSLRFYPDYFYGKGLLYYTSKPAKYIGTFNGIFKEYELEKLLTQDFKNSLDNYSAINTKINMIDSYKSGDFITDYQLLDINAYMVDDILTKVDRASMSNSLEVRVPLLDHEFMELAFQIPSELKIKNGEGKYIFKKSLENKIPKEILYRKKQGFAVPLTKWFRNDLIDYLKNELLKKNDLLHTFLNRKEIEKIIENHLKGKRDFSAQIWTLLFFNEWLKK